MLPPDDRNGKQMSNEKIKMAIVGGAVDLRLDNSIVGHDVAAPLLPLNGELGLETAGEPIG